MIPQTGHALIEIGETALELFTRIGLGSTQSTQFFIDFIMQTIIIEQAEEIGLDQVQDMLLDDIGRNRVTLRADLLVSSLMLRADIVPRLVALPTGLGCAGQSSAAHAAVDASSQ